MSLRELEKKRLIRSIPVDKRQIENLVTVAKRDLKVAGDLLANNFDWSYSISYNSMLQISRALMFSYGYTTSEEEHHKTVVEFARAVLGKEQEMTEMLDRMRRKRHGITYDEADTVSEYEAKQAYETARRYFGIIEKRIKEKVG
jgi:uncharacterized protein (UPF0332 family)